MTKVDDAAPAVTEVLSSTERKAIADMIKAKVNDAQQLNDWNPKKWSFGDLGTTLRSCSDRTLMVIRDYLLADVQGFINREEREGFLFALAQKGDKITGTTIHEYIAFSAGINVSGFTTKIGLIRGLHRYSQLPDMENYAYADEATKNNVSTLLSAAGELISHDLIKRLFSPSEQPVNSDGDKTPRETGIPVSSADKAIILTDANLIDLLLERPESAREITDFVTKRGINDGALIREMFDSAHPSIREGLL